MPTPTSTESHPPPGIWTTKTPIRIGVTPPKGETLLNPDPWSILAEEKRQEFQAQCAAWKDSLQSLLTFVGLFSAIVAGLITATYKDLGVNPTGALLEVALRIEKVMQGTQLDYTSAPPSNSNHPSYRPDESYLRSANELWFASLMLSLCTAVFGVLCLQWIQENQRTPEVGTRRDALVAWSARAEAFNQSWIPTIIDFLPLFLLISFCFFLVGLWAFTLCFWGFYLSLTPHGLVFGTFPIERPVGFVYTSAQSCAFWYIFWWCISRVPVFIATHVALSLLSLCYAFAALYGLCHPDLGFATAFDSMIAPALGCYQRGVQMSDEYFAKLTPHLQWYWNTSWVHSGLQDKEVSGTGYRHLSEAFGTLTSKSAQHLYAAYCCIQDISSPASMAQTKPFPRNQDAGALSSFPERRLLLSWANSSRELARTEYQVQLLNMLPDTHVWSTGYELARYQLELFIRILSAIYVYPRMECASNTAGITGSFVPGLLKPEGRFVLVSMNGGAECIEQLVLILTSGINTLFTQPDDVPFDRYIRRNDILQLVALVLPHAFVFLAQFRDQEGNQKPPDRDIAYHILQALSKTQGLLSSRIHDAVTVEDQAALTSPTRYREAVRRLSWMAQAYLSLTLDGVLSPTCDQGPNQCGWAGIRSLESLDQDHITSEYTASLGTLLQHTDTLLTALILSGDSGTCKTEGYTWDQGASSEVQNIKPLGADERLSLLQTQFNLHRQPPEPHLVSTLSRVFATLSDTPGLSSDQPEALVSDQPDLSPLRQPDPSIRSSSDPSPNSGAVIIEVTRPDSHSIDPNTPPNHSPLHAPSGNVDSDGDSETLVGLGSRTTPPLALAGVVDHRAVGARSRVAGDDEDAPDLVVIPPQDEVH